MRIILFIHSFVLALFLLPFSAKSENRDDTVVRITKVSAVKVGDTLHITMLIEHNDKNLPSKHYQLLTPTLIAEKGQKALPVVIIHGKNSDKSYSRALKLMSKKERIAFDKNPPYAIMKGYKAKDGQVVNYSFTVLFEKWMEEARIVIKRDLCGCSQVPYETDSSVLLAKVDMGERKQESEPEPQKEEPIGNPLFLPAQKPKTTIVRESVRVAVDFPVNGAVILPTYMNNRSELKKVEKFIDKILTDSTLIVKHIEISGYASPEGAIKANKVLSEKRTIAMKNYLNKRMNNNVAIVAIPGFENWTGLVQLLDTTDFDYKDEILNIIQSGVTDTEATKQKLKDLGGGKPYAMMVKSLFPMLRVTICRVDFEVKKLSVVDYIKIYKTTPWRLSVEQIYMVAQTFDAGSQECYNAYKTAAKVHPDDDVANINAAAMAIINKDCNLAQSYLIRVSDKGLQAYKVNLKILNKLKNNINQFVKTSH